MNIICILGRSGSGKSTIEKAIEQLGYNRIISYTTREIRGNEQNGKDYHFVNHKQFRGLIEKDILMEYAEYNGNFYGAPKPVGSINNVIVVERNGYLKIKELYGSQATGVYVDVPLDVIGERIVGRNDTSSSDIKKRSSEDDRVFEHIKDEVDIIIDGTQPIAESVAEILRFVKSK